MSKTHLNSALWVVATPLGNLGDVSTRALSVLQAAQLILAEDTRRTGLLLSKLGIARKELLSLHEHNEEQRISLVMEKVLQGVDCCLVSDAGTPLLSDPGYRLVRAFRLERLPVIPVPGPSAPATALMASGIPPVPFCFLGFMPRKKGDIKSLFSIWKDVPTTLVFFERKNRVRQCLEIALEYLGPREFCLAREMTKKFEEFIFGTLDRPNVSWDSLQGEITLVIGPPVRDLRKSSSDEVLRIAGECLCQDLSPKKMVKVIQDKTWGWSSKEIYDLVIKGGARCRR